ncbi:polysaccharide deacetylase [Lucifera butyrica]|uniref:Polysaccharide deacetylase n=1 Tax=Lucifera butyrica TaxID=1351585 RepID=A0A498RH95_9FIRM|nr:polysaccharide deacetylase family protein [Lucifera butyrica]VBB09483.1 polysaccharide deacetylase [Lucifera butyrica]
MKKRVIVIVLFIFIAIGLAGVFLFKPFFTTRTNGDYHSNITGLQDAYNADADIMQAQERMKENQAKAIVILHGDRSRRQIALTFDGLTDRTTMQQILDLLKKYNVKATFFVDGMQAAEDPQTVANIRSAGQNIENYTLSGRAKMENLPVERLIKDFCYSQKIIKVLTDQGPNLLKCNNTKYTDSLLRVAKACGFNSVVKTDVFFDGKKINSLQAADDFVSKIRPGSIVSIKLETGPEPIPNESGKTDLRPAVDKQPGLKELPKATELGNKEIADAIERVCIALQKANYTTDYVEDFATFSQDKINFLQSRTEKVKANFSLLAKTALFIQQQVRALFSCRTAYAAELMAKANEIRFIPTTEPALAYTFGGLSNKTVVNDVLGKLNDLGIKATFFVTETEMKKEPETIREIIENGHEIGITITPKGRANFDETFKAILRCRKGLQEQFGVTADLVKQPWGAISDATKEAVFAAGCNLIGQSINIVQSKDKDYTSADQVITEIFRNSIISLARGDILYFRMDFYTNDQLVGNLIEAIKQRKIDNIAYATSFDNPANNPANDSQYVIKPVGAILNNPEFVYQYPVDPVNIPAPLRIEESELQIDEHHFLSEASKRYIGNEDVSYDDRMLGFSKREVRRLDHTGFVHTKDKVIFLTFDDWGSDAAINKILYVLRKHNVPATFFILTHNVLNNPNLLRTIAVEGNNIGCHSDLHKPMVVRDPNTGKQAGTQDKKEYVRELAAAYQKLLDVTGDVTIGGKPALTRFFRPPQMAISKMGLEALLTTGYQYIVGGSETYDYKAKSVSQIVKRMGDILYTPSGELRKGAILVMHMGDPEVYTATALDILLTANEAKADSDPSKFKVGRLSDYLTDGYAQINDYWQINKSTE